MRLNMKFARAMSSLALCSVLLAPSRAGAQTPGAAQWLEAALASDSVGRFDTPVPPGTDPVAAALVDWDRLRNPSYPASFAQLSAFLLANPGWPEAATMRARAERAVGAATPLAERIAFFERYPPEGGGAIYRLAEAYAAEGRAADASAAARRAWTSASLPAPLETQLLARFGPTLGAADHAARADLLLWTRQTGAAQRMLPLMAADAQTWTAARIALQTRAPDAAARLAAVPPAYAADPGLLLDRARWLIATGDPAAARRLIADTPIAPGTARDPVRWMRLRLELARAAGKAGEAEIAYRLAADHAAFPMGRALNDRSFAERDAFTDIEWLAGFVALRDLHRPQDALTHFSRYQAGAQSPATRAKGLYWAARAEEAAGQMPLARSFLAQAGVAPETFYGQLATERLGQRLILPPTPLVAITSPDQARLDADPLARAARLLGQVGARSRQSIFLKALAERAATPAERELVAQMAPGFGRPDLAVIVGKAGRNQGGPWAAYAYPLLAFANLLDGGWTMMHAIARQESQFDPAARSHAGALGLMQLMPGTARQTADKLGLGFSVARLTGDQSYNAQLGSGYYGQLLSQWGGSHVLAVASYNAGAGNVRKWIALNGDPRAPGADPVAWIEAIPFSETRTYVERVLENAVVYDLLRPGVRPVSRAPLSGYLGKAATG